MKKLIISTLLLLISLFGATQNKKYFALMKKNIQYLDSAKNETQYLAAAMGFEKLAVQERKEWLPDYYAAMAYVLIAYGKEGEEIDKWTDKADKFINYADSLSSNNAEIYVLKAMAASSRIMVDPMARAFMYGKQAYDFSQTAMTLDPNNPRPHANKGQGTFYTPDTFGGGALKAKPHLEKALERYKIFKPASDIHPNWGKKMCEDLLKKCNEE